VGLVLSLVLAVPPEIGFLGVLTFLTTCPRDPG